MIVARRVTQSFYASIFIISRDHDIIPHWIVPRKKSNSICRGNAESSLETSAYRRHLWWESFAPARRSQPSPRTTVRNLSELREDGNILSRMSREYNVGFDMLSLCFVLTKMWNNNSIRFT